MPGSLSALNKYLLSGRINSSYGASLVAQWSLLLPMQETWVQPLGLEDPLEKEMATHSSILAWGILWTEEHGPWCLKSQT